MKKIKEMNIYQKYFMVTMIVYVAEVGDIDKIEYHSNPVYTILKLIKEDCGKGKRYFVIDTEGVLHFGDWSVEIQRIIDDIEEYGLSTDYDVFENINEYISTLENDRDVLINGDWYNYGLLSPSDDWSYVEAYDLRNGDQDIYVFVNTVPTGTMLEEIRSSEGDFDTVVEKDNSVNDIISIWENMDINNQYDTFLDFTRYLYHRYLDSDNGEKYLTMHKLCKELIVTKVVTSLNNKMRRSIFIAADTIAVADKVSFIRCILSELHDAFCDYVADDDEIPVGVVVYKHCKISGVDMLISSGSVYDIIKTPYNCDLTCDQIMQAIYDARSPEYVPVDPDDQDTDYYPVYKNPDDIIPGIKE